MQLTKSTKEESLVSAIKRQQFTRRRKPDVIKVYSLEQAVRKLPISIVAKELAYCLSTSHSDRLTLSRYMFAYNCAYLKDWNSIAVISKTEDIKLFSDVSCVNFKDLDAYNNDFFKKLLLNELIILRKNI